jgi:hypothetical protein
VIIVNICSSSKLFLDVNYRYQKLFVNVTVGRNKRKNNPGINTEDKLVTVIIKRETKHKHSDIDTADKF